MRQLGPSPVLGQCEQSQSLELGQLTRGASSLTFGYLLRHERVQGRGAVGTCEFDGVVRSRHRTPNSQVNADIERLVFTRMISIAIVNQEMNRWLAGNANSIVIRPMGDD